MTTREQQEVRYWPTVKGLAALSRSLLGASGSLTGLTCQRSLFDASNDPYNHWRDDQDKPLRRDQVPCTCGRCPVEEVRHGGLVEMAERIYPR